ncbi:MAG TPA: META domain-containing protein [Gemmatimonadales bacterium]|nr:META domain-containing protein [Gemmatimonadales bacterium]
MRTAAGIAALSLVAVLLAACPRPRSGAPADSTTAASARDTMSPAPPVTATDTAPPAPPAPAAPLEGTEWRLAEIGGQPQPAESATIRTPGFTLTASGRKVHGSAGCNRMTGTYELDGANLKFGPLATTRMACPGMATESAFLKALEATTRYEIAGTRLTLFGADTAVARLEKAGSPAPK